MFRCETCFATCPRENNDNHAKHDVYLRGLRMAVGSGVQEFRDECLLGGSWVVSGVISPLIWFISIVILHNPTYNYPGTSK